MHIYISTLYIGTHMRKYRDVFTIYSNLKLDIYNLSVYNNLVIIIIIIIMIY